MVLPRTSLNEEIKAILNEYTIPVHAVTISQRVSYTCSPMTGSVFRSDDQRAKNEIVNLAGEIFGRFLQTYQHSTEQTMGNEYEDNRKKLVTQIKNEPSQTPTQEVQPVEPAAKVKAIKNGPRPNEESINFWGPIDLIQWVKHYSVSSKKSIKQICIEALEAYRQANK